MSALVSLATIVHIILCVLIVLVVLLQQGKGAEISASFGGSSQTVFGSTGGATFFSNFTWACAALFTVTSIFLAMQGSSHFMGKSVMAAQATSKAPVSVTRHAISPGAATAGHAAAAPAKTAPTQAASAKSASAHQAALAHTKAAPAHAAPSHKM